MFSTDANLAMQEFQLTPADRRRMRIALRFSTGVCLALVATAAAAGSVPALAALALVGVAAGWTSRHPFDHVWNGVIGRLRDVPRIPPTPRRRRHAFKVAAVWVGSIAVAFATGHDTAGAVIAAGLVVACGIQTFTYLCLPSLVIAAWEALTPGGPR